MSDLLTTGGVLAAFLAGGVALFAPCCIVFLAPSYLAAAVKNRRLRLLPLTFAFATGLAMVLVPITLGISLMAATLARYHAPLYYAGATLLLLLAALALSGRMWSLPSFLRTPDTARGDSASFFALGVFAGVASSCCAPVLAGVMTLSALSGSAAGGVALGLAYVLGMTFPLFLMALGWDRLRLGQRRWTRARPVRLRIGRRTIVTNTVNIVVAATFAAMSGFVFYLAGTDQMTRGPGFQTAIGEALGRVFDRLLAWLAPVPEPVLGLLVLAAAGGLVYATVGNRRRPATPADETCHEPAPTGRGSDPTAKD